MADECVSWFLPSAIHQIVQRGGQESMQTYEVLIWRKKIKYEMIITSISISDDSKLDFTKYLEFLIDVKEKLSSSNLFLNLGSNHVFKSC